MTDAVARTTPGHPGPARDEVDDLALDDPQARRRPGTPPAPPRGRARGPPGPAGPAPPGPCCGSAGGTGSRRGRPRAPSRPSSASISRTMWPLPSPPIAGLQDISPRRSNRCVTSTVRAPTVRRQRGLRAGMAAADDDDVDDRDVSRETVLLAEAEAARRSRRAPPLHPPSRRGNQARAAPPAAPPPPAPPRLGPRELRRAAADAGRGRGSTACALPRVRHESPRRATRAPQHAATPPAARRSRCPVMPEPPALGRRSAGRPSRARRGPRRLHADAEPGQSRRASSTRNSRRSAARGPLRGRGRSRGASTGRRPPRSPAMSSSVTGRPSRSIRTSITSRVVPATSEVSAASRPASAFSSVDLPTFGAADERDLEAVAQPLGDAAAGELPLASSAITAPRSARDGASTSPGRSSSAKSIARLDEGERARSEPRRQPSAVRRERAAMSASGLPLLRRGLGRDSRRAPRPAPGRAGRSSARAG